MTELEQVNEQWRHRLEASWSREDEAGMSVIAAGLELAALKEELRQAGLREQRLRQTIEDLRSRHG